MHFSHREIFRQINSLVISLFSEKADFTTFLLERHSVEKREIHCHANFFRQINL